MPNFRNSMTVAPPLHIQLVSPLIGIYPGANSLLVMDNCRIHNKSFIIEAAQNVCGGIGALFIPAYSPQFAPIESAFSAMKQWLKSNRDLVQSVDANTSLDLSILSSMSAQNCKAWILEIYPD